MSSRTQDAYEEMRAADRSAWISEPAARAAAEEDARYALQAAHRTLSRFGGSVMSFVDMLEAKSFPSPAAKQAAFNVAGAAVAVEERTKELEEVLRMHSSAVTAIERAQLRLQEAQGVLSKALETREDSEGAPASVGHR